MNHYSHSVTLRAAILALAVCGNAFAVKDPTNQGRWEKPCESGPDAVVPGFLINMGPTGARGTLTEEAFVVKYLFAKSPADGVLQLEDEVLGANGKTFSKHSFAKGVHGIDGPIRDLGLAIEDSEGSDGVLKLMLRRGGKDMAVDLQLEKLGRFAEGFPVNCAKTALLKDRAYRYLIEHPGGIDSQGRCVEILSMLSSEDPKVSEEGRRLAKEWAKPYNDQTWTWHLGFQSIVMGEYYRLSGDPLALEVLKKNMSLLRNAQWKGPIHHWTTQQIKTADQAAIDKHQAFYEGGFGHAPHPFIVARGGGGYGPMQWPTCLALMSWQYGKQFGLEVDPAGPSKAMQFLELGTTNGGHVAYGGEFTLNNGPVDPAQWKLDTRHSFSHKSGLAYLVYMLSPELKQSADMRKLHLENIGAAYSDMTDGHACAIMGYTWGLAGVYASGDPELKKKITDYYKALFNMSRCHGSDSYIVLPGRDHADLSYYRDNSRNHMTAAMAFVYSFGTPKLRIQGVAPGAQAWLK